MVSTDAPPEVRRRSLRLKKLGLLRTYLRGGPPWCSWQVTDRCNFRCEFCLDWRRTEPRRELTVDEIALAAQKLAVNGTMLVGTAGGEALLRDDFPQVVRALNRFHFVHLTTNGSLVTRETARALVQAGLWSVGISLDYAESERHDARRAFKGAYRRAVDALRIFAEERTRRRPQVKLVTMLLEDNLDDLPKLAALAARHGADMLVQPYCELKTGERRPLKPGRISWKLRALQRRFPNLVTNPMALERFDVALARGIPNCVAGRYMLNIDTTGNVAKCIEDRAHPVGNILTDDLQILLKRLRARHRANTCTHCWYSCRSELEAFYKLRGMVYSMLRNFVVR
ncbi:MAG TPA: radical SAM protein [Planctomycetota bacterium]|nr:radical SAM protein [Planctomycetota bacterium]